MKKLIWIGEPYFANAMRQCGWEQVFIHKPEVGKIFTWEQIVALAGFAPDVLVVADCSRPPFVVGMEGFPCLTVFYAVDSHIHSWLPFYAQGFDAALISLKDHIATFASQFLHQDRCWWSPPFAPDRAQPRPDIIPDLDALFVGTNNPELMPRRAGLLAEVQKRVPGFKVMQGDYARLFPRSRVLLNQSEHGDMNFRVFEALGCGVALVSPRMGHGLEQLFTYEKDFAVYDAGDVDGAVKQIQYLLAHDTLRQRMASAGLAKVNAAHRPIHRARAFTEHLLKVSFQELISQRQGRRQQLTSFLTPLYLHFAEELENKDLKLHYLNAARGRAKVTSQINGSDTEISNG